MMKEQEEKILNGSKMSAFSLKKLSETGIKSMNDWKLVGQTTSQHIIKSDHPAINFIPETFTIDGDLLDRVD